MKKYSCILLSFMLLFLTACKGGTDSSDLSSSSDTPPMTEVDYDDGIHDGKDYLGSENGYFTQNGSSEYKIVVSQNATGSELKAASEIQLYVNNVTNVTLDIITDEASTYNNNDKVISVGKTVYQSGTSILSNVNYADLSTGGYFVKNDNNVYLLDSDENEGIVYAAYEFLSVFFGVEFLTYDYTYIPAQADVKAYEIDYLTIPAFPIRDYYAYSVWYQGEGFGAKLRLNSPTYKCTSGVSGLNEYDYYGYYYDESDLSKFPSREGHTTQSLLCADAYKNGYVPEYSYKTSEGGASIWYPLGYWGVKPDWYAYDPNYDRVNSKGYSQEEICYSNGIDENGDWIEQSMDVSLEEMNLVTKMIDICTNMVINEVSESAKYLMLGHADYYAECKCDKCLVAEEKYGGFGGITAVWTNAVVKGTKARLAELGCDREVKFVMFAYSKSIEAPVKKNAQGEFEPVHEKVVLDDDIFIKMAYRNCVYHSLWDETCEENEIKRNDFRGWEKVGKSFEIWDYSCVFPKYLYYLPNLGTIVDNYLYYQEKGVEHVLTQGCPGEYNFYEANIHQWVCSELLWDPTQNVNALIKKFHTLYFGEDYAPYVDVYRDIYENYYAICDIENPKGFHTSTKHEFDAFSPDTYSYPVLTKAANIIQEAIDKAKADTTLLDTERENLILRLRSVKITPQFMILDLGYVTDEQLKVEIATDFFTSIDLLKLTYMSEGTSEPFSDMKAMILGA